MYEIGAATTSGTCTTMVIEVLLTSTQQLSGKTILKYYYGYRGTAYLCSTTVL